MINELGAELRVKLGHYNNIGRRIGDDERFQNHNGGRSLTSSLQRKHDPSLLHENNRCLYSF
jgi:hypothetical protein